VEIHCDAANARSAAVPRRLGYRLDREVPSEITVPGGSGVEQYWVTP
jgi:RimJ/RimL family protein N-acetyltransferase